MKAIKPIQLHLKWSWSLLRACQECGSLFQELLRSLAAATMFFIFFVASSWVRNPSPQSGVNIRRSGEMNSRAVWARLAISSTLSGTLGFTNTLQTTNTNNSIIAVRILLLLIMIIKLCCGDSVPILVLAMVTTPSCIPNLLRFFMKLRSFFLSASSMVAWTEAVSAGQAPASPT